MEEKILNRFIKQGSEIEGWFLPADMLSLVSQEITSYTCSTFLEDLTETWFSLTRPLLE
tara:strand:+ start:224 stop:400 length:177 start_codon:yes stop_codon:yes gene_type:complete